MVLSQSAAEQCSVVDILTEAPEGLAFKTAAGVDFHLKNERESWGQ